MHTTISRSTAAVVVAGGLLAGAAAVGAPGTGTTSLGAPVAAAHSVLLEATPADGSTVDAAPASVTLTFNEDVNPDFATLTVMDSGRKNHAQGTPRVEGGEVTAEVDTLAGGDYTVGYRVTSADGHVIQGSTRFTVAGGSGQPAGDAQSQTSPNTPGGDDTAGSGISPELALGVVGAVALALMGVAVWLLRRTRS